MFKAIEGQTHSTLAREGDCLEFSRIDIATSYSFIPKVRCGRMPGWSLPIYTPSNSASRIAIDFPLIHLHSVPNHTSHRKDLADNDLVKGLRGELTRAAVQ